MFESTSFIYIVYFNRLCYGLIVGNMQKRKRLPSNKPADARSRKSITACIRCGTCCKKGGPSFHHADKRLIEEGIIHSRWLYTIRKGELAYDNVRERLLPADSDIIKLKGQNDSWTCIFFDESQRACRIYAHRPMECKALQCWDTRRLEKIYAKHRLTRADLISEIEGLWGLVEDHQRRCDYDAIQKLVKALDRPQKKKTRKQLIEIIQYDSEIRKLVVAKAGLSADMLDFLFGRPLTLTIQNFGVRVNPSGEKISLMPPIRRSPAC